MQTEAEKYLIGVLRKILTKAKSKLKMINLGAAKSTVIEKELIKENVEFICDRTDIQDCNISEPYVEKSYICPLENMQVVPSENYDVAFANFVLEHVSDPYKSAAEMARILKPGGQLILSLSNPRAPEFILAKLTPTKFHQLFREEDHDEAYPVKYSYKSVKNLISIFERVGLICLEDKRFAFTYGYLYSFPLIRHISRAYDKLLTIFHFNFIMSHSVLVLNKEIKTKNDL